MSVGQRKKSESLTGIKPEHQVGTLSTDLWELMESKVTWLSSYVTGILHTARIKRPCSPWVLVSQWIEHLPVFWRSWVRFLSGTQIFSLSPTCVMLISSLFTLSQLLNEIRKYVKDPYWAGLFFMTMMQSLSVILHHVILANSKQTALLGQQHVC